MVAHERGMFANCTHIIVSTVNPIMLGVPLFGKIGGQTFSSKIMGSCCSRTML